MSNNPKAHPSFREHLVDGKFSIKELIDLEKLKQTLEKFSTATGFTTGFVSYPDQKLLIGTGWRDICTKFHRKCTESEIICKESNQYLTGELKSLKEMAISHCKAGLVDGATPIIVKGKHIANLFTGQILFQKPDIDFFRTQGEKYEYDVEAYLDALKQVPVVNEKQFKAALAFLSEIALQIAEQSLANLKAMENAKRLEREIAERKQAEVNLEKSRAVLYAAISQSPSGILIADAPDVKIRFANKAAFGIRGSTDEPLTEIEFTEHSKKWQTFSPDGKTPYLPEKLPLSRAILEGVTSKNVEVIIRNEKGESRWVSANAGPVKDKDGQVISGVVVFSDITERKKAEKEKKLLEAQLQHHQKLESIGTLAAGVAHEINNPINGIMNYAQLISNEMTMGTPMKKYADEIISESERIAAIVRNLLAFSRQELQKHSPARMEDILNSTLSLIRTVMKKDQINIKVTLERDLPTIKCRTQHIQQVLMNLITNARDALNERYKGFDENKIIDINASMFQKEGRRWIRITVKDHGIGIPQKIMDRLFDPFYTTKERDKGTGLGLSISYGIVKDHHGELLVESKVGEYTCFHIDLPVDNGWNIDK